jgi:hypothetical protein
VSTVYIFGAGASKHVGYPLISEMGSVNEAAMSRERNRSVQPT